MRVGIGFDSHRLADGGPLLLGGVEIDHAQHLEGHSDADVLTHAVIDAVLGAAGLGDIGNHFPDTDERWAGADSLELLRLAAAQLPGRVVNVDATVICQEPRLGPYREGMEANLSAVLSAPVSVKASTNEGMGAIGRGEGIACIAVALVDV
jgi:2-C-methyl-D-erythritol 2,4-cyclodiphosphate synthase